MSFVNVEFKARCSDFDPLRQTLESLEAESTGTDQQIDTYFKVGHGRLKLREGNIENALVYYNRLDNGGPKESHVLLMNTEPHSPIKEILAQSLGVLTVIEKEREIYFLDNVKFHLDTVKNLGRFVEVEAIDILGTFGSGKLKEQCQSYFKLFKISPDDLIAGSYSDLMMAR